MRLLAYFILRELVFPVCVTCEFSLVMIAFGSCNHQKFPQEYWLDILKDKPETFLWIGDAVYAKNNTLSGLKYAYDKQLNSPYYEEFQNKIKLMDGIYDDHDYGVNDGGRFVDNQGIRKKMFLTENEPPVGSD